MRRLIDSTRNMIDAKRLEVMKEGAILLNSRATARGRCRGVQALNAKRLRSYLCDFPATALQDFASLALPLWAPRREGRRQLRCDGRRSGAQLPGAG